MSTDELLKLYTENEKLKARIEKLRGALEYTLEKNEDFVSRMFGWDGGDPMGTSRRAANVSNELGRKALAQDDEEKEIMSQNFRETTLCLLSSLVLTWGYMMKRMF